MSEVSLASYKYHIKPFGDQAVLIQFDEPVSKELQKYITSVYKLLRQESRSGLVSLIPAYNSLTVAFHPAMTNRELVMELINRVCISDLVLEESVFMDKNDVKETKQIVIKGITKKNREKVQWSLSKK